MKPTIKIGSCDFWSPFELRHSIFYDILVECGYDPIIDNENPDILFYSVFGNNHRQHQTPIKIWFSGENWGLPNFNECNFALSGYYIDDPRHYRLPLYIKYARNYIKSNGILKTYKQLSEPIELSCIKQKTKFCNFIYSNCNQNNPGVKFRHDFFNKLSKYKHIDSGGSCLNNVNGKIINKIDFISNYKFTIAMENSNEWNGIYGYTTEKIFEPFMVNSIPIYWGNPYINNDFNPKSFINYHDYNNIDILIDKIIEIDSNNNTYEKYLITPPITNYDISPFNLEKIITFFKNNIL
jgi:hypothetical protein